MHSFTSFIVACVLLIAGAARAGDFKTEHYDVHCEALDDRDVGAMLEQYHSLLHEFFGKSPEGRLRVEIYSSDARFHAALRADHQSARNAGGYYAPDTRTAYLFVQPSDYFTRQLLLHECAHQFHFLAATSEGGPHCEWYIEGLAEYLGMHDWDGKTLHIGVVPKISLEDYPAAAAAHWNGPIHRDLAAMIAGTVPTKRPEDWAMVHFLVNQHPREFKQIAAQLNRGGDPVESWKAALGPVTPKTADEFENWLMAHQQPWKIASIAWQQRGDAIEGKTSDEAVGIALLKQTPAALTVEIEPLDPPIMAGLVFGYESQSSYWLVQAMSDGGVRLIQRRENRWLAPANLKAPAPIGRPTLAIRRQGKSVTVTANAKDVATVDAPAEGEAGLNIQEGRTRFLVGAK